MFKKIKLAITTALAITILTANTITVQAAPVQADIKDLFDSKYYAEQNEDVKAIYGNDEKALYEHFINHGINEERNFSTAFNLELYKKRYPDLEKTFGDNRKLYIEHYLTHGINENRDGGGDFDIVTYLKNNPDIADTLNNDFSLIKEHYDNHGKEEGIDAASPFKKKLEEEALAIRIEKAKKASKEDKKEQKINEPAEEKYIIIGECFAEIYPLYPGR